MNAVTRPVQRSREGWIASYKPPHVSFANFLRERLRFNIKEVFYEPLEVVYGAGCAYVALKVLRPGQKPVVRGVVAQVEHVSGLAGEANIIWRVHDEERLGQVFTYSDGRSSYVAGKQATLSSVFSRCPRSVLERLTDTTNARALSWRKSCWAKVHEQEALGRRPLARGDVASLPESMTFNDGVRRHTFLIVKSEPLFAIAFGSPPRPILLAPYSRLLIPTEKLDLGLTPTGETVEILTASHGDCVGYLARTTQSQQVLGATNDAALGIAFERQWNAAQRNREFPEFDALGASP